MTALSAFLREAADLIETTAPDEAVLGAWADTIADPPRTWEGRLVRVGATALDPALSMPLVAILRTAATTADRTLVGPSLANTTEDMGPYQRDSVRLVQAALAVARVVLGRQS
jgi:hypothetical protein